MIDIFTQEEIQPSKKTLDFIRQFAYTYRAININGRVIRYSLT